MTTKRTLEAQLEEMKAVARLNIKHEYLEVRDGDHDVFYVACDDPNCSAAANICIGLHFWCSYHADVKNRRNKS